LRFGARITMLAMDPLTHTLVGAALAETRWARRTALAFPALLIASNLPDVDGIAYLIDSDVALFHRRGWTHGVAAPVIFPPLVAGLALAWDHWVRSRPSVEPPVRPRWILGLASLGVLVHLILDWLNSYGVRFLMPLDGRWFYGDVLHIVDPLIWLVLGGALFLARSRTGLSLALWALLAAAATIVVFYRLPFPVEMRVIWLAAISGLAGLRMGRLGPVGEVGRRRVVVAGCALFGAYVSAQLVSEYAAGRIAASELAGATVQPVEALMAAPVAGNPFSRDVLAARPDHYRFGRFDWRTRPRLTLDPRAIPRREPSEAVRAALRSDKARGMVAWARFPYHEVVETTDGFVVYLLDARYARTRRGGFGAAVVRLDHNLREMTGTE
jgi:inner membrane protein